MKQIIIIVLVVLAMAGVYSKQSFTEETKTVQTEDRRNIAFDHYKNGSETVIVLAHGFYNNKDTVLFKQMSEMFHKKYDVICFDFRGHGESDGVFTWTVYEEKDLRAVVKYAKEQGYKKVGVVGFSLGAAISLIETNHNEDIDSLIAVSPPYDFWEIDYDLFEEETLEDIKLNMGPKGKGKSIRPGNPFMRKTRPIDIVQEISPTPVMFLHGDKDWLINVEHSEKLYEKAQEPKQKVILEGAGHADRIYDRFPEKFEEVCFKWFEDTL